MEEIQNENEETNENANLNEIENENEDTTENETLNGIQNEEETPNEEEISTEDNNHKSEVENENNNVEENQNTTESEQMESENVFVEDDSKNIDDDQSKNGTEENVDQEKIEDEAKGMDSNEIIEQNEISTEETKTEEVLEIPEEKEESIESFIGQIINSVLDEVTKTKEDIIEDSEKEIDNEKVESFIEYHEVERIEETAEPEEEEVQVQVDRISENADLQPEEAEEENKENIDEDYEHEEDEMKLNREELIQELKNASLEEKSLLERSTSLQHKIGDFLRKKKVEQTSAAIAEEKGIVDFEQKYLKQMETLRELIQQYENENVDYKTKIEDLQNITANLERKVKEDKEKFQNYRLAISQKSINTRTGKSLSPKDLESISLMEDKKEIQVVETRLISIKLQNEVNKIDSILKSKEELAEGLHLIDFEQFKIENQSYNEKLEERVEDLSKLRKKITSNVHILTHVKEKLEFIKYEFYIEQNMLKEIDEKLSNSRDKLTSLKQSRDRLRSSNQKLKKSCGMLGNSDLLRNYEDSVDTVEMQMEKMNDMKNRQIKLTLRNQALQMKIDNARMESSHG